MFPRWRLLRPAAPEIPGTGRHESDPMRVVPFVPAFIAAMTLKIKLPEKYDVDESNSLPSTLKELS